MTANDSCPSAAATACDVTPESTASVECSPRIPWAVTTGTFATRQIFCDGTVDNGCPVCAEVAYAWDYPDGCTLATRAEQAAAPAGFWPGKPLYARLMSSYFDDCGQVGNLSLPVTGCAEGKSSQIPQPTDIATLTPDGRAVPITITNLACYAYQAQIRVRWCVTYVP